MKLLVAAGGSPASSRRTAYIFQLPTFFSFHRLKGIVEESLSMKVKFLFAVLSGLLFLQAVSATEVQREFQVEPGKQLRLDLKTGADIRIEGWDKPVFRIDGSLTGDSDNFDVRIEQTTTGIEVRTRYIGNRRHYDSNGEFDIRVPSRFNVDIDSMGGSVIIRNVEGEFDGSTMGGSLDLSGLKGRISLSTMGGDVTLTKSHLDGQVSTMGGEVLLEEISGTVKGSSMGGKVVQKKSSGTDSKTGEVEISSMGGALNVQDAPEGAVLSTMGGDIHVVSAGDHVRAKTMGGDIRIDSIDGWV
jgi:hypothetical protein